MHNSPAAAEQKGSSRLKGWRAEVLHPDPPAPAKFPPGAFRSLLKPCPIAGEGKHGSIPLIKGTMQEELSHLPPVMVGTQHACGCSLGVLACANPAVLCSPAAEAVALVSPFQCGLPIFLCISENGQMDEELVLYP